MRLTCTTGLGLGLIFGLVAACRTVAPATPPPAPVPHPGDAALIEQSHAFFHAVDHAEVATLEPWVAAGFTDVHAARVFDREVLLKQLRARAGQTWPKVIERSFRRDAIRWQGDVAIVTAFTTRTTQGAADAAPVSLERQVTLVWTPSPGGYQVALMATIDAGLEAERQTWNDYYQTSMSFNASPNRLLVEVTRGVTPGKALDIGMGMGRNALYLAGNGWEVTGVDIADEGVRLAEAAAAQGGLHLTTVIADVNRWDWGTRQWDLIALIYVGGHGEIAGLVERARTALRPGGLVVLEYFSAESETGKAIGGFGRGELSAAFADGFEVLRDDTVEDVADFGLTRTQLVRFVARRR